MQHCLLVIYIDAADVGVHDGRMSRGWVMSKVVVC